MDYSKIVSVTGLSGLFELLSSKGDGAIVRSLDDKSTRFVSSRVHNFSHLESIEVYTTHDNVNLTDVFQKMQAATSVLPDDKDNAAVKKYFEEVYPEMDFERVYTSDMKKMVKWFRILTANQVEIKIAQPEEARAEPGTAEPAPEAGQEQKADTAKPAKPRKAKAEKEEVSKEEEAKPKKKSSATKKPGE